MPRHRARSPGCASAQAEARRGHPHTHPLGGRRRSPQGSWRGHRTRRSLLNAPRRSWGLSGRCATLGHGSARCVWRFRRRSAWGSKLFLLLSGFCLTGFRHRASSPRVSCPPWPLAAPLARFRSSEIPETSRIALVATWRLWEGARNVGVESRAQRGQGRPHFFREEARFMEPIPILTEKLAGLSDSALDESARRFARREKRNGAAVIAHLAEISRRDLHLKLGYYDLGIGISSSTWRIGSDSGAAPRG